MSENFYTLLQRDPVRALEVAHGRVEAHRINDHGTDDREAFFDCATCGVLEKQETRAARAVARMAGEGA